jgi:hypothetical protein
MGKFLRASAFTELARFMADYTHWPRAVGSARASEPLEEQIERRVYELWQKAGFPEGREEDFRRQAERELRNRTKTRSDADA